MLLDAIRLGHPLRDVRLVIDGLVQRTPEEDAAQTRGAELERMATAISTAQETGYRQGRADADASFTEQLMMQRQEVLELAEGVLRTLADQHASLSAQARACVPGLVMNIVRRVLAGGEPDGAQIQKIIEQALAETPQASDQPLEVFLCPSDLTQLETMGGDALREKHPRVSLRPDVSLSPRDCLVRGNFGLIDGRMETKLKGIEKLLATH